MNKKLAAIAAAAGVVAGVGALAVKPPRCEPVAVTAHCGGVVVTLDQCGDELHVSEHIRSLRVPERCTLDTDAGTFSLTELASP